MNYFKHKYSDLERKYFLFYLDARKKYTDKYLQKNASRFHNHLHKLKESGLSVMPSGFIDTERLLPVKNKIHDYFSNKTSRVMKDPLITVDELYPLIKDYLIPFASFYYECVPSISYVKVLRSQKGEKLPKDTQLFHRDPGSHNFIKAIIYLNEVGVNDGPFTYIEDSIGDYFVGSCGRSRQSDEDIYKKYKNKIIEITGPCGQVTFFNPLGLHRGKIPVNSDRIAIIVNLALHPEYGQKDNYKRIHYNMKKQYDEYDFMILDSCVPVFGE